ncbi:MAG TPA: HAD-IA family hydrolase [Ignavibacteria bacterium]|nr:HAD-IA family hydrolase [Ignavibacteria bacterium]
MGKTFMFGGDRFGASQNYEETYRSFGGCRLPSDDIHELINHIYSTLLIVSREPDYFDNFPTVREFMDIDNRFIMYDSYEKDLLEQVFAYHECGSVPDECKDVLLKLSMSHRLGLISNVWCNSLYFTNKLKSENIHDIFEHVIFSSDHGTVKPSPKLFNMATGCFGVHPSDILFIGDNYKRDVIGSMNAGMKSVWVNKNDEMYNGIKPDFEIKHIRELVES